MTPQLRKYTTPTLLLVASGVFLMLFSGNTSPLTVGDWGDYSIYKYLGLGILEGKLPYLDLFDNKGVLLYAINALGMSIPALGSRWGIFLLQLLSITFSLWMLYKIAGLFVPHCKALISVLAALLLLGGLYQGGDHVEEWMLPFLSICLYLTFKLAQDFSDKNLFCLALVGGLSVGCVLLLRPNDAAALGLGISISVLLLAYKLGLSTKTWINLLVACALVLLSMTVVLLPVVFVYAHNDALNYLWNGMLETNAKMNNGWGGQLFSLFKWGKWAILLLLITLFMMAHTVDRSLNVCLIPLGLAQLFFVGAKLYAHYLIVFFPLLVVYLSLLWRQHHKQVVILAIAVLMLSHRPLPRMMLLNAMASSRSLCQYHESEREDAAQLLSLIPHGATVWNYNLDPYNFELSPLVENRVVQCNRLVDHGHRVYVDEKDFWLMQPQYVLAIGDSFEWDTMFSAGYIRLGCTSVDIDMRLYGR